VIGSGNRQLVLPELAVILAVILLRFGSGGVLVRQLLIRAKQLAMYTWAHRVVNGWSSIAFER
jgi:hypothetical protein